MNKNYKRRDEIIFGAYEKEKYFGGVRRFNCSRETILNLLEEDFISPDECQNCSPYVKDFVEYTEGIDETKFECYAVSPDRDDYRVSIEGVDFIIPDTDFDNVTMAVDISRSADEFSFEHAKNNYYIHAWWD